MYVFNSTSGLLGVHAYWFCPETEVMAPSVEGVIENAACTTSRETERENVSTNEPSVGTSF